MPTWVIFASLGMGALAGLVVVFGFFGVRWHLAREWRFSRWSAEVEITAVELIQAELRVAELQVKLAALAGRIPDDFNAPIFQAARVGAKLERAAYLEAERLGLIPPGVFTPIEGLLPPDPVVGEPAAPSAAAPELPAVEPPPPSPPPAVAAPAPTPPPTTSNGHTPTRAFALIGGQLVAVPPPLN